MAEAFGYSAEELTSIPAEANMDFPAAILQQPPIASRRDRRRSWLWRRTRRIPGRETGGAERPCHRHRYDAGDDRAGAHQCSRRRLHECRIPPGAHRQAALPDASVDCVISNCVLNLAPDKPAVFREIARVLKPGGRLAVSDIALKGELPEAIAHSLAAYVGCIAGAILMEDLSRRTAEGGICCTLKS